MRRTEAHQGVRMIKYLSVLSRYEAAELSQLEAAELLGMSERTFRRWGQRFEEDGEAGLLDRRLGKASGKVLAKRRARGFRLTGRRRSKRFTGRGMRGSRPNIFMTIWCAITSLHGAIRGRRRFCIRRDYWSAPNGAARIGASVRAAPCQA